jgi:hypothetical protein
MNLARASVGLGYQCRSAAPRREGGGRNVE